MTYEYYDVSNRKLSRIRYRSLIHSVLVGRRQALTLRADYAD